MSEREREKEEREETVGAIVTVSEVKWDTVAMCMSLLSTLSLPTLLRTVVWDDNGTTLEGLKSVTEAVK